MTTPTPDISSFEDRVSANQIITAIHLAIAAQQDPEILNRMRGFLGTVLDKHPTVLSATNEYLRLVEGIMGAIPENEEKPGL